MITFSCTGCCKSFTVGDDHAGKEGVCRQCGAKLRVPLPTATAAIRVSFAETAQETSSAATDSRAIRGAGDQGSLAAPPTTATKLSPRLRRLHADAEQIQRLLNLSRMIQVRATYGNPPERYEIEYSVRGLARGPAGVPIARDSHLVEIQLTREYPRQSPHCKMLTPVFHPNIEPAVICVGDHWTAAERLVDLIVRIGEMIAYQAYNIKSPLDGEAAMWADLHRTQLPIDARNLRPAEV